MLKIIILLSYISCAFAHPNLSILGGHDALDGQIPYQVSVQTCDWSGCSHDCGGSIISKKWILTAGHCYSYGEHNQILAGTVKLSQKDNYTQIIKVKATYVNRDYRGNDNPNDIALMEIEEPLVYNDRVQPIKLPEPGFETTGPANTSGWGFITFGLVPKLPDILQWLEMKILPGGECQIELDKIRPAGSDHFDQVANICAENIEGVHTVCKGDSGSPMVQGDRIIGLTSWGAIPCFKKNAPPVFTKISNYIEWIHNITGELN